MLNIQKYEKELKKYGTHFAVTPEGTVVDCDLWECDECLLDYGCSHKRIEWLLQEYKEPIQPILTGDDKTFLKSLIGSYKEYADSIEIVYTLRPGYTGPPDYTSGSDKNLAIRSVKIKLVLPHKLENETLTWYITWPILNDSLLKNLKFGPVYTIDELELYK